MINPKGKDFLYCKRSIEIINLDKFSEPRKFHKTIEEFRVNIIDKLNSLANNSIQYIAAPTQKYVHIKCINCSMFSFWYKNIENIDIQEFCDKNGVKDLTIKRGSLVNLVFARAIN